VNDSGEESGLVAESPPKKKTKVRKESVVAKKPRGKKALQQPQPEEEEEREEEEEEEKEEQEELDVVGAAPPKTRRGGKLPAAAAGGAKKRGGKKNPVMVEEEEVQETQFSPVVVVEDAEVEIAGTPTQVHSGFRPGVGKGRPGRKEVVVVHEEGASDGDDDDLYSMPAPAKKGKKLLMNGIENGGGSKLDRFKLEEQRKIGAEIELEKFIKNSAEVQKGLRALAALLLIVLMGLQSKIVSSPCSKPNKPVLSPKK
jgi:hypothetical protein